MLSKLKRIISEKKQINVVYLGGSITEGAGVKKPELRWASKIHSWFQEQYPEIEWKEYNAGIGGTNSEFGVFRLKSDVLVYEPDVVFVEFAVNDKGAAEDQSLNAMEGIVRGILKSNLQCQIIFVLTATDDMLTEFYDKGQLPGSVLMHERVASHYHIPAINVGMALHKRICEEAVGSEIYLADTVHPNEKGYALYYEAVKEYLEKELESPCDAQEIKTEELPSFLGDDRYGHPRMISAVELAQGAFRKEEMSLHKRYQNYISSDISGTKGTIEFEGTGIGVYWSMTKDSGILSFQIDDGEVREASSWDEYALYLERCNHRMLMRELPYGKHRLTFWVSENKDELSKGHFIRIAAFLIM